MCSISKIDFQTNGCSLERRDSLEQKCRLLYDNSETKEARLDCTCSEGNICNDLRNAKLLTRKRLTCFHGEDWILSSDRRFSIGQGLLNTHPQLLSFLKVC